MTETFLSFNHNLFRPWLFSSMVMFDFLSPKRMAKMMELQTNRDTLEKHILSPKNDFANTQTVKNLVPSLFSASALVFLLPFTLIIQ